MPPLELGGKKIALVGFFPQEYEVANYQQGNRMVTKYSYRTDFNNPTLKYLAFGKSIREFPATGIDTTVSRERLQGLLDFVAKDFNNRVKIGTKERRAEFIEKYFSDMIVYRYKPSKRSSEASNNQPEIALNKRDVDYYIVGYYPHRPVHKEKPNIVHAFIWLISAGVVPITGENVTNLKVGIFDKQLNMVKTFQVSARARRYSSWWLHIYHPWEDVTDQQSKQAIFKNVSEKINQLVAETLK